MKRTLSEVKKLALSEYLNGGHCSEMLFKHIGSEWALDFDNDLVRIANPFGGGIAGRNDVCGALVGGLMVIGYLTGRRTITRDAQKVCWSLSRAYYDRFEERFKATSCSVIHGPVYNRTTHVRCAKTVLESMELLWSILSDAKKEGLI